MVLLDNKAILPFQIPVANPLTSAVQFVQGSVQDGLRNLDEGAKAVLATAPEIPLVHTDGTVTLVPGGLAGLQQLHDDAAKVIVGALNVESLDPTKVKTRTSQFMVLESLVLRLMNLALIAWSDCSNSDCQH